MVAYSQGRPQGGTRRPWETKFSHISLSTYSELNQSGSIWDINGSLGSLQFLKNGNPVLQMRSTGVTISGENLMIGGDFWAGQNMASPDGSNAHYLSFGLRPISSGFGASGTTGAMLQATPTGDMYFYSKPNSSGGITSSTFENFNTMTIKNDGKIGIGTLNPTQLLTVYSQEDAPVIRLGSDKNTDWEIYTDSGLRFRGGTDGVGDALSDHLIIAEDGRILINVDPMATFPDVGTNQPFKLYVNGGIAAKEVRVLTGWADYVFEDDYAVMPLDQVEEFIQENHHLPNIPSAEKVETSGLNLGEMSKLQQEKIEELFLHVIELSKKIKTLQAENEKLKTFVKNH